MTENRPCRFCSIAVTLATRTCVRLRARWVGGLSSATVTSPSAALSLSYNYLTFEKISAAQKNNVAVNQPPDQLARSIHCYGGHAKTVTRNGECCMQLLTDDEGALAVRSARAAVEYAVAKRPKASFDLPPVFGEKRGVFVTLTINGSLRGCIGFPYPVMPLGEAIAQAAVAAAREDPRFPPVSKQELAAISLEVTVLTVPESLDAEPARTTGSCYSRETRSYRPGYGYKRPSAPAGCNRVRMGCEDVS